MDASDSYQSLRWGKMVAWRADSVASRALPSVRQTFQGVTAELAEDSVGYVLVARTATEFGISAADVAMVKQRYLTGVHYRDSVRTHLRQLTTALRDTTVGFYQLVHAFSFQNSRGQAETDSVEFVLDKQGKVIHLKDYYVSPAATFLDEGQANADTLPPPPPPPPKLGKAIRYY